MCENVKPPNSVRKVKVEKKTEGKYGTNAKGDRDYISDALCPLCCGVELNDPKLLLLGGLADQAEFAIPLNPTTVDGLKGLAGPPVIWGLRPPVSAEGVGAIDGVLVDPIIDVDPLWVIGLLASVPGTPVNAGVDGPEPGMGGKDSNRDAPKEDDGLNGLRVNPVVCGTRGVETDAEVLEGAVVLREKADGADVVENLLSNEVRLVPDGVVSLTRDKFVNDEATLLMSVLPALRAPELNPKEPVKAPVD
jgi:hypothetical protein